MDRREGSGRCPSAPGPAAAALGRTLLQREFTEAAINFGRLGA
ncbi:hypothetical protein [Streptomyces sp. NPDC048266]